VATQLNARKRPAVVGGIDGRKVFFVIVLIFLFYITAPFLAPLALGGVLAIVFHPLMPRLTRFINSRTLRGILVTLLAVSTIVLPTAFLVYLGAQKGLEYLPTLQQSIVQSATADGRFSAAHLPGLGRLLESAQKHFPLVAQKLENLQQLSLERLVGLAASVMSNLVREIPGLVIQLFVMLVSLYYFLVDGERLTDYFREYSMFSRPVTRQLLQAIHNNAKSVVLATVISGLAQSSLMAIALLIVGTSNLALMCFAVFICSFLPLIGTSPVTISATIYYFVTDGAGHGVVMLIAAVLIALVDNIVRPAVLRGKANLHPLVGFISAFGGLSAIGFYGLFLGPIIAGIVFALLPYVIEGRRQDMPAGRTRGNHAKLSPRRPRGARVQPSTMTH